MTRLAVAALLAASFVAAPAQADLVRYDFAGTLSGGGFDVAGPALEAEAGFFGGSGGYSGYILFDTADPDQDGGPDEAYVSQDFQLNLGSYSFGPAPSNLGLGRVVFSSDEFILGFQSTADFSPSIDGDFLDLTLSFLVPGIGGGAAQSPLAANGSASLTIIGDGGGLFAGGDVTSLTPSTAPVPEPATWALLIAGFGLAGIALRRGGGASINSFGIRVIQARAQPG